MEERNWYLPSRSSDRRSRAVPSASSRYGSMSGRRSKAREAEGGTPPIAVTESHCTCTATASIYGWNNGNAPAFVSTSYLVLIFMMGCRFSDLHELSLTSPGLERRSTWWLKPRSLTLLGEVVAITIMVAMRCWLGTEHFLKCGFTEVG
ncbi:hypothetical protein DFH07DRAFT_936047 [Mycena maculata]|uniref:Uncharacterized protein n=1 Tax=Mycena maculata TaxID=230809 RepID=A0AAD7K7T7_9AGAR|nr:hypothetical protein DFH07DRAFT_936047 [Mycena maculata]